MRELLMILTPIAVVVLVLTRLVSLEWLKRNRGYILVLVFIVSAIVIPPDVISMSIMAVSMYLLYEVGLLFARLFLRM